MRHGVSRIVLLVPAFAVMAAPSVRGATYHSQLYGYSVAIPEGWKQIPEASIASAISALQGPDPDIKIIYDVGFQPADSIQWLTYPYVFVQVLPYADFGLDRQLTEDEWPEIIQNITGANMEDHAEQNISPEYRELFRNVEARSPRLDRANRRFFWAMDMDIPSFGPLRASGTGHFGRESLIQIFLYSHRDRTEQYMPMYDALVGSFRFDPEKEYDPILAASQSSSKSLWPRVLKKGLIGAILGGVAGAWACLSRKKRK